MKDEALEKVKDKCVECCDTVLKTIEEYGDYNDSAKFLYLKKTFLAIRPLILNMLEDAESIS